MGEKLPIVIGFFNFSVLVLSLFLPVSHNNDFSQVTSDVVSKSKQRDAGVSGKNTFRWHLSCTQGALIKDGGR